MAEKRVVITAAAKGEAESVAAEVGGGATAVASNREVAAGAELAILRYHSTL